MAEATVKVEGLAEFVRDLKKFAPAVAKEFNARMRVISSSIVADARIRAGWSTTIPGAIAPMVTGKGVGVRVSKKRAPTAGLFERGNKGSRGGTFRHPLFGDRNFWFEQPTRPFLQPAVNAKRDEVVEQMFRVLEDVGREVLKGER